MSQKPPSDSFGLPPGDNDGKMTNEQLAKFLEEHSNRLNKMANSSSEQPSEFDASQLDLDSLAAEIDKISDAAPWDNTTAGNTPAQNIDASNFPDEIPADNKQFTFNEHKAAPVKKSKFELPNLDLPENVIEEVKKEEPIQPNLSDTASFSYEKPSAVPTASPTSKPNEDKKKDSVFEKGLNTAGALGGIAAGTASSTFALGKEAFKDKKKPVQNDPPKVDNQQPEIPIQMNLANQDVVSPNTSSGYDRSTAKEKIVIEEPKKSEGVPFFAFLMLLTYASAATLGLVYFMMQSMNGNSKDLESLPDIVPPMNGDQVMYPLVPESRNMANGHSLSLGTSRRFGNLIVTPVGVTREALEFAHYTGDDTKKREAVKPVLKLWLRFENVSQDQTITPLDRKLMLTRNPDPEDPEWLRSNNFVVKKQNKSKPKKQWLMYDMEINGDWNFAGGPNDQEIKPGEKLDTFLPSEVIEEDLDGRMVWRVHFRKGHNPETKNGVTTLIEVLFDDTDIKEPIGSGEQV